jgi:hypothetical protein
MINQLSSLWNFAENYFQQRDVMSGLPTVSVNNDGVFDVNTCENSSVAHILKPHI